MDSRTYSNWLLSENCDSYTWLYDNIACSNSNCGINDNFDNIVNNINEYCSNKDNNCRVQNNEWNDNNKVTINSDFITK